MARYLIPSDTFLKAIKPGDPRKRISDGDGLVLLLFGSPASTAGGRAVSVTCPAVGARRGLAAKRR